MKRLVLGFGILLFFSTALITCADMVIIYKSGNCSVDIDGKGRWVQASLDMVLNAQSIVKTGPDAILEIGINGESVVVTGNSTVVVHTLQNRIRSKNRFTWFKGLNNAFHTMISGRGAGSDRMVLGVRGAKHEEGEVGWMEDIDSTDLMEQYSRGVELYNNEQWGEAIEIFSKLVHNDDMVEMKGEISFYLGSALFNNVQYEEAIPYLVESIKQPDTFYREAALIHYSLALFFAGNYTESVRVCNMYGDEYTGGEFAPYAFLIAGKSYKNLGKSAEAKMYFNRIVNEYPQTGVYQDAVGELQGM
jgi:tetratricopeptide (TPR) repeat protein